MFICIYKISGVYSRRMTCAAHARLPRSVLLYDGDGSHCVVSAALKRLFISGQSHCTKHEICRVYCVVKCSIAGGVIGHKGHAWIMTAQAERDQ